MDCTNLDEMDPGQLSAFLVETKGSHEYRVLREAAKAKLSGHTALYELWVERLPESQRWRLHPAWDIASAVAPGKRLRLHPPKRCNCGRYSRFYAANIGHRC